MEEIAGFEDRLNNLKTKGDALISQCAEHLQAKLTQHVQAHLQGTKDSYSAICSTAQRVSTTARPGVTVKQGGSLCNPEGCKIVLMLQSSGYFWRMSRQEHRFQALWTQNFLLSDICFLPILLFRELMSNLFKFCFVCFLFDNHQYFF